MREAVEEMTDSIEDDEVQAVQYEMEPVVIDSNGRTVAWLDDMVAVAQSSLHGAPGDAVQWCGADLFFVMAPSLGALANGCSHIQLPNGDVCSMTLFPRRMNALRIRPATFW